MKILDQCLLKREGQEQPTGVISNSPVSGGFAALLKGDQGCDGGVRRNDLIFFFLPGKEAVDIWKLLL